MYAGAYRCRASRDPGIPLFVEGGDIRNVLQIDVGHQDLVDPGAVGFQQALQAGQHFAGLLVNVGVIRGGYFHHVEGAVVDDHV
ncbi:hypothetical protein LMCDFJHI_02406 [Aeromonas salmonicida]